MNAFSYGLNEMIIAARMSRHDSINAASMMSTESYLADFKTLKIKAPRGIGKTTAIFELMTEHSVVLNLSTGQSRMMYQQFYEYIDREERMVEGSDSSYAFDLSRAAVVNRPKVLRGVPIEKYTFMKYLNDKIEMANGRLPISIVVNGRIRADVVFIDCSRDNIGNYVKLRATVYNFFFNRGRLEDSPVFVFLE